MVENKLERESEPATCHASPTNFQPTSKAYFFFPAAFGTAAAFALAFALAFADRSEGRRDGFAGFDSFGKIGLSESKRQASQTCWEGIIVDQLLHTYEYFIHQVEKEKAW